MIFLLLTIFITMGLSFLCSVMEASLLSLSLADIGRISEKKPLIARIWRNFKEKIERPITVILIINTLAHTIGASLSGAQFEELFGPRWIVLFSIAFSLAMIQWTEILPKTLGVRYNKRIAVLTALPLKLLMHIFTPFVWVVHFLNKPFAGKKGKPGQASAIEDISVLARFAALDNLISRDQEAILSQTISISGMKVSDVMVAREEIKYLSTKMSLTDALIQAHIHHHTRFPLIAGDNTDDVIGYVNFKDIVSVLQTNPKDPTLKGISRPILEVGAEEPVSSILGRLRRSCQHIAIVRDQEKKVSGIVTLEDVVEAIMGDIEDEYDIMPDYVYQIAPDRYIAGGGISLEKLKGVISQELPQGDIALDKWLAELLGKTPKVEDRVRYGNCTFIMRKMRRSRVYEAIIQIDQPRA